MSKKTKEFQRGDRVTWSSSANGSTTTKTGVIVEVVPQHRLPTMRDHQGRLVAYNTRDEISYIVMVPQVGKRGARHPKYYWPRAEALAGVRGKKPGPGHPLYLSA